MKRTSLILLSFAFLVTLGFHSSPAAAQTSWQQINVPPLPAFHPQEPKRIVLPNGMVIFLQEDHELPLIDGIARIRGGSRSEPAEKTGLIDMYGDVWRTGGTKTQTGDQLDDYLEIRAAKVETSGTADSTTISWSCLKADFDDVFKVFDDLLRAPEFRDDKLELAQRQYFDAISRRNDDVDEIVGRESAKLAYGAQNPYARVAEYKTVAAVTRQDLVDWHHSHVSPNNIILGIVGDFDSAAMEAKLRQTLRRMAQGTSDEGGQIPSPRRPSPAITWSRRTMSTRAQSAWWVSESGATIRTTTRSAYSTKLSAADFPRACSAPSAPRKDWPTRWAAESELPSTIPAWCAWPWERKAPRTLESIQALDEQIDDVSKHPITDAEIKLAKDAILNSFIFNLDSPDKILRERMAYEFYGYPQDYLEKFRLGVDKVTAADVARAGCQISAQGKAGHAGGRQFRGIRQAAVVAGAGDERRHHDSSAPGPVSVGGRPRPPRLT